MPRRTTNDIVIMAASSAEDSARLSPFGLGVARLHTYLAPSRCMHVQERSRVPLADGPEWSIFGMFFAATRAAMM